MSSCQPTFAAPPPPPPPLPPAVDARNPPARMNVSLPGVPSTAPFEYYSGFLDAGVPPSGRGTMYFHYICAMAPTGAPSRSPSGTTAGRARRRPTASSKSLARTCSPRSRTRRTSTAARGCRRRSPTRGRGRTSRRCARSTARRPSAPRTARKATARRRAPAGRAGDAYTCGPWSDATTAAANHRAHQALFTQAFPEFEASQQPVFLTGESYAGIYVPLFVDAWLADPVVGPGGRPINFGGFAVGDGFPGCVAVEGRPVDWCVDLENVAFFKYPNALPGPFWDVEFFHGHSQMSESLYRRIQTNCSAAELKGASPSARAACRSSTRCRRRLDSSTPTTWTRRAPTRCPPRRLRGDGCSPAAPAARCAAARARRRRATATPASARRASARRWTTISPRTRRSRRWGFPSTTTSSSSTTASASTTRPTRRSSATLYRRAAAAGKRILVYEGDTDACGLQTAPIEDIWVPYFGGAADAPPDGWTPVGPYNTTAASAPLSCRRRKSGGRLASSRRGARCRADSSSSGPAATRAASVRGAGPPPAALPPGGELHADEGLPRGERARRPPSTRSETRAPRRSRIFIATHASAAPVPVPSGPLSRSLARSFPLPTHARARPHAGAASSPLRPPLRVALEVRRMRSLSACFGRSFADGSSSFVIGSVSGSPLARHVAPRLDRVAVVHLPALRLDRVAHQLERHRAHHLVLALVGAAVAARLLERLQRAPLVVQRTLHLWARPRRERRFRPPRRRRGSRRRASPAAAASRAGGRARPRAPRAASRGPARRGGAPWAARRRGA